MQASRRYISCTSRHSISCVGTVLASACWDAVALCEHESWRDYRLAIQLLLLLLRSPFCPHRRGRYYLRLLIDLRNLRLAKDNNDAALMLSDCEDVVLYLVGTIAKAENALKVGIKTA